MEKRRIRFVMSVELAVEDPVAVVSSQLRLVRDGESGEVGPQAFPPDRVQFALMHLLGSAVSDVVAKTPGLTFESGTTEALSPNDDGSYSEVTVRALPAPDEQV